MNLPELDLLLIEVALAGVIVLTVLAFAQTAQGKNVSHPMLDMGMRICTGMLLGTVAGSSLLKFMENPEWWYVPLVGAATGSIGGYLWSFLPDIKKRHINSRFTEAAEWVIIAIISMGAAGAASIFMLYAANEIGMAVVR